jgi:hypothetical protein
MTAKAKFEQREPGMAESVEWLLIGLKGRGRLAWYPWASRGLATEAWKLRLEVRKLRKDLGKRSGGYSPSL